MPRPATDIRTSTDSRPLLRRGWPTRSRSSPIRRSSSSRWCSLVALRAGPSPGRGARMGGGCDRLLRPAAVVRALSSCAPAGCRSPSIRRERRLIPGLVALACLVGSRAPPPCCARPLFALVVADVAGLVAPRRRPASEAVAAHGRRRGGGGRGRGAPHSMVGVAWRPWSRWWGGAGAGGRHTVGQVIAGATIGVVLSGVVFGVCGDRRHRCCSGSTSPSRDWSARWLLDGKLLSGTYAASAAPRRPPSCSTRRRRTGFAGADLAGDTGPAVRGFVAAARHGGARVLGVAGAVGGARRRPVDTLARRRWRGRRRAVVLDVRRMGRWGRSPAPGVRRWPGVRRRVVEVGVHPVSTSRPGTRGTTWARDESTGTPS